ncbi:MAG: Spy/CpxP family protein refolding chaperone [Bacteroidales bacterium]
MNTKKIVAVIAIIVIGLQIALSAQEAKPKSSHPGIQPMPNQMQHEGDLKNIPPMPPPPPPILPGIPNLTKEQSESIHKLQLNVAQAKFPLENNVREKEARLHTISTVKVPDMQAIEKQIDEIASVKVQLAKLQAAHDQDIRKVLDDEQRLIFDKRPPMPEPRPF